MPAAGPGPNCDLLLASPVQAVDRARSCPRLGDLAVLWEFLHPAVSPRSPEPSSYEDTACISGRCKSAQSEAKSASDADRRLSLLSKLLKRFPDYAERVCQIGRPAPLATAAAVIHVFVDISNTMIGFHHAVKVLRKASGNARLGRPPLLSFGNLSLILERGRTAAKRVLVGSDRTPTVVEAESLGYETNILDRVLKQRRRRRRRQHQQQQSETDAPPEERWVEQGVDEVLHLKMLESLVDAGQPATIVLATGDAAPAEYSGGFMQMVVRALARGWQVELLSFAAVTSSAYLKKDFRRQWKGRFRITMLDDYAGELARR